MSETLFQTAIFLGSLLLMSLSSFVLTVLLEKIGTRFSLSEGLLGILTALGADAPEISSSVTALSSGHHELGLGVVLGSNIFNLAVLLGLSALVAGLVRVRTAGAIFNGSIAFLAGLIASLLLLGWVAPWLALTLIILLVAPYVWVVALSPTRIKHLPLLPVIRNFLANAVQLVQKDARLDQQQPQATTVDYLALIPALFAIIAGSRGMVSSTLALTSRFSIPHDVAGTLGIAALTGIPNAVAAIRLAVRGRGSAVETECFNSNTLNLVFGICLPALIVGFGAPSARTYFAAAWLAGMTLVAIFLLCARTGLRRFGGSVLLALYLIFAGAICLWPRIFPA